MLRPFAALLLACSLALPLPAQQFKFNLDHLQSKAANAVDLSLNGSTLQFAARFLDGKDEDEAKVKKLIAGLEGIYIKAFEFKSAGVWTAADLDQIRNQLRAPEWSRIVGIKSAEAGEAAEVYMRMEKQKVTGVAILATEATSLTVVNIVGPVDLDTLAELSGHLGVPKLEGKAK
jgi:hypothetical protein